MRHEIILEAVECQGLSADLVVRCTCGKILHCVSEDKGSKLTLNEVTKIVSGHYLEGVQS